MKALVLTHDFVNGLLVTKIVNGVIKEEKRIDVNDAAVLKEIISFEPNDLIVFGRSALTNDVMQHCEENSIKIAFLPL